MSNPYSNNYSSAGRTQASFKIDESLHSQFKQHCNDKGESMTDVIVGLIEQEIETAGGTPATDYLPDDNRLANALSTLRQHSTQAGLPSGYAETVLAETLRIDKDLIRRSVLNPLEREGWIRYDYGRVAVSMPPDNETGDLLNEPTTRSKIENDADEQLAQIDASEPVRAVPDGGRP